MSLATVGAARIVFGADTTEFDSAAKGVEGVLGRLIERFHEVQERLRTVGAAATIGITLPFAAMVRSVDRGAGAFEASMKNVEAALDNVTGSQLKQLSDQARTLGPKVGKSATEAAATIEQLALAGLSASDVLGGGLKSALDLATAGMVEGANAAGLVTDVMGQFGKTSADLSTVVTNVVGSLDKSKFRFDDFRLALGQAGSVAAASGVTFREFSAAIAVTSDQFASGSDAGTSFRTYLQSLTGNSDEAKGAMKALGLEFFDAQGKMKPLAEQAQMLRDAFGSLTEESRAEALKKIFGADGARTAIGLMNKAREGFERYQRAIDSGDVNAKIAKRLEGDVAAGRRISNAWESLKISIGDTGLLTAITMIKTRFAELLEGFAAAPPLILTIAGAFAGVAAAIGPLILVLGTVASFILPLVAARFGIVGLAISALINPVGTLAIVVARLVSNWAGGLILAKIGSMLAGVLSPVGLLVIAITGLTYVWQLHQATIAKSIAEQERLRTTMNGAKPALDKAATAIAALTGKTGDAAKAARAHADAMLKEARAAVIAAEQIARKNLVVAKGAEAAAKRYADNASSFRFGASGAATGGVVQVGVDAMRQTAARAKAEAQAAADGVKEARTQLGELDKAINAPSKKLRSINFDDPAKTKAAAKERAGASAADLAARREELRLQAELEAARERGDFQTAKRLADQIELTAQVRAYRDTELSAADAQREAARDIAMLRDARAKAAEREQAADTDAIEIEWASVTANHALEQSLRDQEELHRRIEVYAERWGDRKKAELLAEEDMNRLLEARAIAQARLIETEARNRAVELAKLRGDSEATIRTLERAAQIQDRARQIERDRNLDYGQGVAQATAEALEEDKARLTGTFRDTIKQGFRAALDGDLGGFVKNWWKDRVAKGLEEALNSLSDLIAKLFSGAMDGAASGGANGGGIFGAIGGALGGLFGGKSGGSDWAGSGGIGLVEGDDVLSRLINKPGPFDKIPGFKNGASFKVGGMSGIDRNVMQMRLSKGEMVNITPANDAGPSGSKTIVIDARGSVMTADLLVEMERLANDTGGRLITDYDRQKGRAASRAIPG